LAGEADRTDDDDDDPHGDRRQRRATDATAVAQALRVPSRLPLAARAGILVLIAAVF
jgi:hypothetical protein